MTDTKLPEVGPWAKEKLEGLRKYLKAYTTILSKRSQLKTVYVDAFAAAGRAVVRRQTHEDPTIHLSLGDDAPDHDARLVIDGSPRVALNIEPPFDQYVFIETDPHRLAELRSLEEDFAGERQIRVHSGDCNEYLSTKLLGALRTDKSWRAVVFLDPFGMHVPWSTVENLAGTKHVEAFINFPVGMAIQRLLPRSADFSASRRAKLDQYFGDPGWFDEVYSADRGLFGGVLRKHLDAGERLVAWYRSRLQAAFGHVSTARLVKNSRGGHLYYLIFAGPNPVGAKIANHILSAASPPMRTRPRR